MSATRDLHAPTVPRALTVALGERSYPIEVAAGLLDDAGARVAAMGAGRRPVVLTDETVAGHYLDRLLASMSGAGLVAETIVLPPGEATKSFAHLESVCERCLGIGVDRGTMLVALGGGVIGDLTGFAAAVLLRGLPFIQVPTTLLAQVDSAVGGKTAINSRAGKNLVGAFHQPRLVLCDTDTLNTLPRRELLAGYAEVVKYGLIDRPGFFAWLEAEGYRLIDDPDLGARDAARIHAILESCGAKAEIVARDERESGQRALLNLGHTFGHALEAEYGFDGRLLHGEAVAAGMAMAFAISARLGLCPAEDVARMRAHLDSVGLPTGPATIDGGHPPEGGWSVDRLMDHMGRDKKVADGRLVFVLTRGIGQAFVAKDVAPDEVRGFLGDWLADTEPTAS